MRKLAKFQWWMQRPNRPRYHRTRPYHSSPTAKKASKGDRDPCADGDKKEQFTVTRWTEATPWHPVLFVEAPGSHLQSRLAPQALLI